MNFSPDPQATCDSMRRGDRAFVVDCLAPDEVHEVYRVWASLRDEYLLTCPDLLVVGPGRRLEDVGGTAAARPRSVTALIGRYPRQVLGSQVQPPRIVPSHAAPTDVVDWVNGFRVDFGHRPQLRARMEHFIRQPFLSECMASDAAPDPGGGINRLALRSNMQRLSDEDTIGSIFVRAGLGEPSRVYRMEGDQGSSSIWIVVADGRELVVKLSLDRLNMAVLWEGARESECVSKAEARFAAEMRAQRIPGIESALAYDSSSLAIVRPRFKPFTPGAEPALTASFVTAISRVGGQPSGPMCKAFKELDDSLRFGISFNEADQLVSDASRVGADVEWKSPRDYSARVELLRWKSYAETLAKRVTSAAPLFAPFLDAWESLYAIASHEGVLPLGVNQGGCDPKNLLIDDRVVFVDNEKIHVGWPGIDLADYLKGSIPGLAARQPDPLIAFLQCAALMPPRLILIWLVLAEVKSLVRVFTIFQGGPEAPGHLQELIRLTMTPDL